MPDDLDPLTPWAQLRRLTDARIALGRAGTSLPTREELAFQLAHAQARDAVTREVDFRPLEQALTVAGEPVLRIDSQATARDLYLKRPDFGRMLDAPSAKLLDAQPRGVDIAIVVGDGLSAPAVEAHAGPLLQLVLPQLRDLGFVFSPILLARGARVALADEVGERLGARLTLGLIGERPGLSSPDSLGAYLTYGPKVGRLDSERNCVSNIRPAGLVYAAAAFKLLYLIRESLRRQLSGVELKDESGPGPERLSAPTPD